MRTAGSESPKPGPGRPQYGWSAKDARLPSVATVSRQRTRRGQAQSVAERAGAVSVCRACPRLGRGRDTVATEGKRASFADQPYWGRPGPGFGDPEPAVLI